MFLWNLTLLASRLLESDRERETMLGDLEERELSGSLRGLGEVLGLICSRQLRYWATLRPWIAAVALFPSMAFQIGNALSIASIMTKYPWQNVEPFTPEKLAAISVFGGLCTAVWSWCLGYGLVRVARAAWVSALLALALAGLMFIDTPEVNAKTKLSSAFFTALLVIAPAIAGIWYRLTKTGIRATAAFGLAAVSILTFHICIEQPVASLAMTILFLWPVLPRFRRATIPGAVAS